MNNHGAGDRGPMGDDREAGIHSQRDEANQLPAGRQAVVTGRLLVYSVAEQGQQVGRRASAPGQMEAGLRHLQGEGEQPQNEGAVGRAYATL